MNLTHIESRPSRKKANHYEVLLDIDCVGSTSVETVLHELKAVTADAKLQGLPKTSALGEIGRDSMYHDTALGRRSYCPANLCRTYTLFLI